jgi:hypothetical protein
MYVGVYIHELRKREHPHRTYNIPVLEPVTFKSDVRENSCGLPCLLSPCGFISKYFLSSNTTKAIVKKLSTNAQIGPVFAHHKQFQSFPQLESFFNKLCWLGMFA